MEVLRDWLAKFAYAIAFGLIVVALFAQSYNGRRDLVRAERHGCQRDSENAAVQVNHIRIDQNADVRVAAAAAVPNQVRKIRRLEVREQTEIASILDRNIDARDWRHVFDKRDRKAVLKNNFSCDHAFPSAPFFRILG